MHWTYSSCCMFLYELFFACIFAVVLRVREVFPGNDSVLGIQVDNNNISLPGELFENLNESGKYNVILYYNVSMFSQYLSHHSTMQTYLMCSREESENYKFM